MANSLAPRRRMTAGQIALVVLLMSLLSAAQLWSYLTYAEVADTASASGLAQNITGTMADAQRDALRSQVLIEQASVGNAAVSDVRKQVAYLAQQLHIARAETEPGPSHDKVLRAIEIQQHIAAELDRVRDASPDEQRVATSALRSDATELSAAVSGLYGQYESAYYERLRKAMADSAGHQRKFYATAVFCGLVGLGLVLSIRRGVRRDFDIAYRLLVAEGQERARAEDAHSKELEHIAYHDRLTGQPNRLHFEQELQTLEPSAGGNAVIFLDLDGFKAVNDSHGDQIGDQVLCAVATRMRSLLREDDLLAHFGGDEFTFLLRGVDEAGTLAVAGRLFEAVADTRLASGRRAGITASIGVAMSSDTSLSGDVLLRRADSAMHEAKAAGGGRVVVFDESRHQRTQNTVATAAKLSEALSRAELYLEYQPIVSSLGQRVGAEALLRWRHGGNVVSPAVFVPIAEDAGLIDEIGSWVLEQACASLAEWQRLHGAGRLHLSVNVSAHQLRDPDYVDRTRRIIAASGVDPHDLILELTESAMIDDAERAQRVMHELKALNVKLALDDFGTGYSSLSHLLHLPVDVVKIDKAFLADVTDNARTRRFLGSIISLAHDLEMEVTVEGVESEQQLEAVLEAGCDQIQGFLFARPVSKAEIEPWLVRESLAMPR